MSASAEDDSCPLCPPSGPPTRASPLLPNGLIDTNTDADADAPDSSDSPGLVWIACSKCNTWYHSACLLLSGEEHRSTVPQSVREEMEKHHADLEAFFDWTVWINRWYCLDCLTKASKSRNPLVATTKANFPPRQPRRSLKRSPSHSHASSPAQQDKKMRTSSPLPGRADDETIPLSAPDLSSHVASGGGVRPKRQVAMNRPDYHAMHHHISTPTAKWLDLIADPAKYNAVISDDNFPRLPGHMVTRDWIESEPGPSSKYPAHLAPTLFYGSKREPLVIKQEDGGFEAMGGKLPSRETTVDDVARLVGGDRTVDVIDVATQQSASWTLDQWAEYIRTGHDPEKRPNKVYNIISLEITGTELAKKVRPPTLVREIDWVDNFWHFGPGGKAAAVAENPQESKAVNGNGEVSGEKVNGGGEVQPDKKKKRTSPWPKVQLYCLMGTKGSWTDWHVDFAASSVYYTIHTGSKVFYFIRPTERNLKAYAEWSGSYEMQQNTWLGSMCDEVRKVTLLQGDTMIIPAGYIHAVYTPMNSIVFGGNFVHSYDIDTQLRLRQIEIDTKVPLRFRFPYFDKLCWYVADRYCADLRQSRSFKPRSVCPIPHTRVLHGLQALARFLLSQVAVLEDETEKDEERSRVYNRIPSDVVKDPSGLARELKWRVDREFGVNGGVNGDAAHGDGVAEGRDSKPVANAMKKEKEKEKVKRMRMKPVVSRTSGFDPREWTQTDHPTEVITSSEHRLRPIIGDNKRYEASESAEIKTTVMKQSRQRVREFEDGTTLLEEQEVVFTERKTQWSPSASR